MTEGARLGVDVGGTFTDLVALVDGALVTAKVPSTPRDQSEGVLASLRAADTGTVAAFAHGMTVATNALLERRGARTALVTTAGFRDVLEIGRQDRPHLYDLARDRPPALIPRALRFSVRERMGPEGELAPLDEESVAAAVAALREAEVEAVAVCLLFAFLHPAHEQRVGAAIRERAARRARVAVERGPARGARVRALRDDRRGRLPRPAPLRLPAQPRRQGRGGGRAGAADHAVERGRRGPRGRGGARLGLRAVGPGRRGRRRHLRRRGERLRGPADASTWAARARTSHRWSAARPRPRPAPWWPACRSATRRSTSTRSARAAARSRMPTRAVRCASGRARQARSPARRATAAAARSRRSRTPTCSSGCSPTAPSWAARSCCGAMRPSARSPRSGEPSGLDAQATALGVVRVADAEMVRALRVVSVERGLTRASSRSPRSAAPAACTRARWPRSSACRPCSCRARAGC